MNRQSITFVGGYDPEYPRIDVILQGCASQDIQVRSIRVKWSSPFIRVRRLKRILKKELIETDFAFVPAFCHHEVPVVKKWSRVPVIFDPLISRYMTKVHDFKKAGRFSIHALNNYLVDKRSLHCADFVLADTDAHKQYYCDKFGISPEKIHTLYVGYNANDFYPVESNSQPDMLTVGFYGSFLPLHGIEVIVEAAWRLQDRRDIKFEIVGKEYTDSMIQKLVQKFGASNITFLGRKPYIELPSLISKWDICLGIFGSSIKADLVIPNKVFHYAGCAKPIITKRSPAITELFTDEKDIFLCEPTPEALADRIVGLCGDWDRCISVGHSAYKKVSTVCSHTQIGARLAKLLDEWR